MLITPVQGRVCFSFGNSRVIIDNFPTLEFQNNLSGKEAPELRSQLQSAQNCPGIAGCASSAQRPFALATNLTSSGSIRPRHSGKKLRRTHGITRHPEN